MIDIMNAFIPTSWLFLDVVAIAMFMLLLAYVIKTEERPIPVVFSMFAFLIYSGIFENIGHSYTRMHPYSPYRLLRIGNIALTVSMTECVLFFTAYLLVRNLVLPKCLKWTKPFMVGILATIPDYVIDTVMAADVYIFDNLPHAQWNWHWADNLQQVYDGAFFKVPFYNFTGWYFLMVWFGLSLALGKWIHKKSNYNTIVGYIYPWFMPITSMMCMMLPTSSLFLFGSFTAQSSRIPELVMLLLWSIIGVILFIIGRKTKESFNAKKNWPIFVMPLAFEVAYGIVAFARGLEIAYIPTIVFTIGHALFLVYIYRQGKTVKS